MIIGISSEFDNFSKIKTFTVQQHELYFSLTFDFVWQLCWYVRLFIVHSVEIKELFWHHLRQISVKVPFHKRTLLVKSNSVSLEAQK